jgi:hypothetical protein
MSGIDDLNLEKIRLPQNFDAGSVTQVTVTVPVRRPNRHEFVRVNDDPEYSFDTLILTSKIDNGMYVVNMDNPEIGDIVANECRPFRLFTAISVQKVVFLWPITLPDRDGNHNIWHRSSMEAANLAKTQWIRMASDRTFGAYRVFHARGNLEEPQWPEEDFFQLFKIAFRDRYIESAEHPVIQQLRGLQ